MRRALPALLVLLLPLAAFSDEPLSELYRRFDHGEHTRTFDRNDVSCLSCHQLGLPGPTMAPPPPGACHQCHVATEAHDATRRAPTRCESCHTALAAPDSHGPSWPTWHGAERDATCSNCHDRKDCVDCHERRQQPDHRVHEPAFLAIHGIEAAAGATCDSCHSRSECLDCHGGTP